MGPPGSLPSGGWWPNERRVGVRVAALGGAAPMGSGSDGSWSQIEIATSTLGARCVLELATKSDPSRFLQRATAELPTVDVRAGPRGASALAA